LSENIIHKERAFNVVNVQLFVWFRILFNCRFYYPVLAIFFVDLGLSLSQYVILNAIWALTIVVLEVPSGALADLIGRKWLVVGSAVIMVVEMSLLLLAPLNGGWLLFSICAVNRFLAGLAEAAASGADEALAYDSLEGGDQQKQWDEVLSTLGRRSAVAMATAMAVGALIYDSNTFTWLSNVIGTPDISSSLTIRLPVFLCLCQGVLAVFVALKLKDNSQQRDQAVGVRQLFVQTLRGFKWVLMTKAALILILGAMLVDAVARNFATLTSNYYRFIEMPEFSFGLIGAGISLCSFVVPFYAKPLARKLGIVGNLCVVALIAAIGLFGLTLFKNAWGIAPAILVMMSLYHVGFVSSRFLNQLTTSDKRATVLSVKSLMFNLSYAFFSIVFAQALAARTVKVGKDQAFADLLWYTPIVFVGGWICYLLVARLQKKR